MQRRAREHARESFDDYDGARRRPAGAECLVVLGGAAVASGQSNDAARLIGAAEALRRGPELDSFETSVLNRYAPELEAALGAELRAELEARGRTLGRASLVAEVVSDGHRGVGSRCPTDEEARNGAR